MSGALDPAWLWLMSGVLLLIAELIAPGFFLMFIGTAAIATGIVCVFVPVAAAVQLGIFAVLAIATVRVGGRRAYQARFDHSADPFLNNPTARLLGRVVVAVQPIDANSGRVRVGDGEWSARGGPARVGDRVRIVDIDGNCLKVEPEHVLPPA